MDKYKKRLLSERLYRNFDSMLKQFPEVSKRKEFVDQLARQLNGAYRIGLLESEPPKQEQNK